MNMSQQIASLERMTVGQLQARYAEVFGEPARSGNRQWLFRRVAWRIQAMAEGDLTERAWERARELARDADLRRSPPRVPTPEGPTPRANGESVVRVALPAGDDARLPAPGSVLHRENKGRAVFVRVLPKGFEYDGEVYRSLSAIAAKVTGPHWNRFRFFGLHGPGMTEGKA
jgi:hypothetical protein